MSLSDETLELLCRYVDFRRRLELAVAELEHRLSQLPADRWRVEPYPLTGERRNTLLLRGETGVFVISATYPPGHWDDVIAVSRLAGKVQLLLPGYSGQVQPAICHPFASARPRLWHRPDEHGVWVGAWVVSGDTVIAWLEYFGTENALHATDLERFDQLAEPNWLRPAIPTLPSCRSRTPRRQERPSERDGHTHDPPRRHAWFADRRIGRIRFAVGRLNAPGGGRRSASQAARSRRRAPAPRRTVR